MLAELPGLVLTAIAIGRKKWLFKEILSTHLFFAVFFILDARTVLYYGRKRD